MSNQNIATKLNIRKPTLLLNPARVNANIDKLVIKAQQSSVRFRPHFKTHQSAQIGEWFKIRGVEAITVSSVEMATYFAQHGWRDITIAFPANILEIEQINKLAAKIELSLLVESKQVVRFLAENLKSAVNVWIKIDAGYGRTGISCNKPEEVVRLAQIIATLPQLTFKGILTHFGNTYAARSSAQIEAIYHEGVANLKIVQKQLVAAGFTQTEISIGDTPSCSVVNDLSNVDEIRPGNFVFYDVTQLEIGACTETEIAVAVACPIVAKHPQRNTVVVYGGAVHLSKDALINNGVPMFGYVALLNDNGWGSRLDHACVSGLSQEHGLIHLDSATLDQLEIGDLIAILPVHSCLTANLLKTYVTLDGEIYAP